ncbi:hypothetical protein [Tychonema bourrellyi]|uniref:hypothetical protein n=1 Tax=Tychonema bourrellyi TaxID=54313 RepID=UPI00117EFEB2|nr:hypothetical protein [Tychonema bourrellyi]
MHHSQLAFYEQARCLFHKKIEFLWNRPDSLLHKMPVPQENRIFVEQASCLLLTQDACSTRK